MYVSLSLSLSSKFHFNYCSYKSEKYRKCQINRYKKSSSSSSSSIASLLSCAHDVYSCREHQNGGQNNPIKYQNHPYLFRLCLKQVPVQSLVTTKNVRDLRIQGIHHLLSYTRKINKSDAYLETMCSHLLLM